MSLAPPISDASRVGALPTLSFHIALLGIWNDNWRSRMRMDEMMTNERGRGRAE